jgi:uncharacterized protein YndB with AHSA1/START domain
MTPSSDAGDVVRDDDGTRLVFVREWEALVTDVWSAVTDPDRLARWFGRWTGDPASGTVQLTPTGEGDEAQPEPVTIDACEPPHRLAVTAGAAGLRWPLELTLTGRPGGGTTLRFVHHLTPDDDVPSTGVGWHYYLDRLDAVVGGREPTDAWDDYFPGLLPRYPDPSAP